MSELSLTLLRLGFLIILWVGIFAILGLMRRDLGVTESRRSRKQSVRAVRPKVRGSAKLSKIVWKNPEGKSRDFPLADGLRIGRAADCDIQLEDDYASSLHAVVTREGEGWLYTDAGSTNGSWVDRQRLEAPLLVRPGTTVRIGKSTLRFEK